MLLTTAYFPPIEYFAAIASGGSSFCLEACENYQKQSYRNRCHICGANGKEMLNVPVVHENGTFHLPITQIRISYATPWVTRTERAIASAYGSSAFFEYYRDGIFSILESRPETLWELNLALMRHLLDKCGITAGIRFSSRFGSEDVLDIHPKRPNSILEDLQLKKPYFQVFSGKYGFIPNLSIIDLLFNEGPGAMEFLRSASPK
ncbi:MAG: WbqC family protein [Bacteroidales bacterium]|nr:WbqC family protein [Bacteroidales bacterium]